MTSSSLLAVVLRGAILACVVIFFAFTIVKPLNWYLLGPWFIQARSRVAINYFDVVQYQGDPTGKAPRGGEWAFEILFQWGTTLAAVVLTIWYRNVRKEAPAWVEVQPAGDDAEAAQPLLRRSRTKPFKVAAKRVLHYQLPPRRFFAWLCGGLSTLDALVVLAWAGLNIVYIYPQYQRGQAKLNVPGQSRLQLSQATMQLICACMGNASTLNLLLLFYPLSRSSFLHWWLGTDFPTLIRYHRWLGVGTMLTLTLHGGGYLCVYISAHLLATQIVWPMGAGVNRMAGVISWGFGVLMWVSSAEFIRRRYFEVFYRMHVLGFVGFIAFGFMHWKDLWVSILPGLLLYMLDLTFRCMQMMHVVHIQRFAISPDRSVATLHFDYAELHDKAINPDQVMFLHIPSVSRLQWHPFTVAAEPAVDGRGSAMAQAHIKGYGKWTRGMIQQLLAKGGLTARVDGPYGGHARPAWVEHNVLAIFAGGIGVTPVLAMLRDIIARRAHFANTGSYGSEGAPPERVYFVFAARSQAELDLVAPTLAAALQEGDWLDVQLYFTGGDVSKAQTTLALTEALEVGPPPIGATPRNTRVQLQQFGDWHLAFASLLSLGGGLAGGILAYAWAAHRDQYTQSPVDHWVVGIVSLLLTCGGAIVVPALIIFPGHIWRACGWAEAATKYEVVESADGGLATLPVMEEPEEAVVNLSNAESLSAKASKQHKEHAGITLLGGRPNITGVLKEICTRHEAEVELCVAAAGPDALVDVVGAACHTHNDSIGWRGRPYLDFHKQAFSL